MDDDVKNVSHTIGSPLESPISTNPETIADAGSREAFLASFTPEEDNSIMKKVDRRFLLLIGVLYLSKTVSTKPHHSQEVRQN